MKGLKTDESAFAWDMIFCLVVKPLSHTVTELLEYGLTDDQAKDVISFALAQGVARYKEKSSAGD